MRKYEQARECYERALAILEKALGPDHPDVAGALTNLGQVANNQARYEDAVTHQERALTIWQKALGPHHPNLAYPLTGLRTALLGLAQPARAMPHLERALTMRSAGKIEPTKLAVTRFVLARALWDAP